MPRGARLAILSGALLAGGCAHQSVLLLPGEEGHPVGAVAVLNEDGSDRGVIATPNTGAALSRHGFHAKTVGQSVVDAEYGALIADMPLPPIHFVLGFDIGESEPAADQEAILQQILKAAADRPGAEVQLVGHTDTTDTEDVNDRVSRRRAEEVRDYLIKRGLPAEQVRATWRGERELLVQTPDSIAEPANRRVEVIIR
jgi:outer membrane protein OmpA-like peptidoglycan-associated protein